MNTDCENEPPNRRVFSNRRIVTLVFESYQLFAAANHPVDLGAIDVSIDLLL